MYTRGFLKTHLLTPKHVISKVLYTINTIYLVMSSFTSLGLREAYRKVEQLGARTIRDNQAGRLGGIQIAA